MLKLTYNSFLGSGYTFNGSLSIQLVHHFSDPRAFGNLQGVTHEGQLIQVLQQIDVIFQVSSCLLYCSASQLGHLTKWLIQIEI